MANRQDKEERGLVILSLTVQNLELNKRISEMKALRRKLSQISGLPPVRLACQITIIVLLTAGCSVERQPIILDETAFRETIEPITIMPILDNRTDTSIPFDEKDSLRLRQLVMTRLQGLGYTVQLADSWPTPSADIPLIDLNTRELSYLVPRDTGSALILSVSQIQDAYKVFTTSFSITATSSLLTLPDRKEIWKNVTQGDYRGFGPIATQIAQVVKVSAAYKDFVDTGFKAFPQKGRF